MRLSEELKEIRTRIDDLRNQRAALESRIAVVWILPNEILAYIFEIGVRDEEHEVARRLEDDRIDNDDNDDDGNDDDDNDDDDDDDVEHLPFQVLVSHVCRAFREVAIHTPTLWSQIHIHDLEPPRLDFVRTCVQRSGCSGLDIIIAWHDDYLESDSVPIHQLMEILVPHIYRFKRFSVQCCGFDVLYYVMQQLSKPAPQLEVLELSDADYENGFDEDDAFEPPGQREPLTLFGGIMPKLKSLTLDGVHVAWARCNFKGLVKMHLGYHTRDVRPTYEEFKTIIEASPALRALHFCASAPFISDETSNSSVYPPLQMERLEKLHISEIPSDHATTLILMLDTPNLMSLSLTDLDTNDYSTFLQRITGPPIRFPALTALKLAAIDVTDNAVEELLGAYPKLIYLGLYFKGRPASISWLKFLEPRGPENDVLCPKLECLRCVSASSFVLKTLLEKRRDAGYPISTLQVDRDTGNSEGLGFMTWIRENATLEIIEASEYGLDDDMDETGSDWATDDEIGGFPYFSMEGFSDEDEEDEDEDENEDEEDEDENEDEDEDEDDYEDASEMEIEVEGNDSESEEG